MPQPPSALGGKLLESNGPDPVGFKPTGKNLILMVHLEEFRPARMNHPAHIHKAADQVDTLPVPEYPFDGWNHTALPV